MHQHLHNETSISTRKAVTVLYFKEHVCMLICVPLPGRPMGETRGPLANRCLGVLRELLHMLADSWTQLGSEIREFLEGIYRATTAISTMAISTCSESVMLCCAM